MTDKVSGKAGQTIQERAEISQKVLDQLRKMLADMPVEILGHLEIEPSCCGGGTVAVVRLDLDKVERK